MKFFPSPLVTKTLDCFNLNHSFSFLKWYYYIEFVFYLYFTPKLVITLTLYNYYLTVYKFIFTFLFPAFFFPTHSFLLGSISFFPNISFRRCCRRFLVINFLISRISPCFSSNNYLNLPHVPYILIYLFGDTYMFILNSWSFWSIYCLPLVQSSTSQGYAWQRLRRRSVQGPILKRVVITVTGVFYSAVATGWAVTIRDMVPARATRGCYVIFSPACPHPWPLHSPASGFYPPLTPPRPTTFSYYIPRGFSQFLSSENYPYLDESVAFSRLSLGEDAASGLIWSSCQISGVFGFVCLVCSQDIYSNTSPIQSWTPWEQRPRLTRPWILTSDIDFDIS